MKRKPDDPNPFFLALLLAPLVILLARHLWYYVQLFRQ